MFFTSCGYACPLQVTDMQRIRAKLPPGVRERAELVLVSFDVARDTPSSLARSRADAGSAQSGRCSTGTATESANSPPCWA